mmetsp:Transcript_71751/g.181020  ORF Transcript_71751/g.181020 Transcript_71751/m.181020 type:complete len:296 (-) Transcript_71751:1033-1920(-)
MFRSMTKGARAAVTPSHLKTIQPIVRTGRRDAEPLCRGNPAHARSHRSSELHPLCSLLVAKVVSLEQLFEQAPVGTCDCAPSIERLEASAGEGILLRLGRLATIANVADGKVDVATSWALPVPVHPSLRRPLALAAAHLALAAAAAEVRGRRRGRARGLAAVADLTDSEVHVPAHAALPIPVRPCNRGSAGQARRRARAANGGADVVRHVGQLLRLGHPAAVARLSDRKVHVLARWALPVAIDTRHWWPLLAAFPAGARLLRRRVLLLRQAAVAAAGVRRPRLGASEAGLTIGEV